MSDFGQLLELYIKRKNLTIKSAAELFGIDRATLHKIISGTRKLKSENTLEHISQSLMLSPDESGELLKLYRISLMGEEAYHRRERISEIINSFSAQSQSVTDPYLGFDDKGYLDSMPEISVMSDKRALTKNITYILMMAFCLDSNVTVIAQPCDGLNDILSLCARQSYNGTFDHIFCMDNCTGNAFANQFNLDILNYSCKLASIQKNYKPYYYYDNAAAHINSNSLMPTAIITKYFVVCTDSSMSYGIIYKNPEICEFYRLRAEQLKKCSRTFLTTVSDYESLIYYWYSIGPVDYVYFYHPCLLIGATPDFMRKSLNMPENLMDIFIETSRNANQDYSNKPIIDLFCEEGLRDFMENGVISDIPCDLYDIPSVEDRKQILSKMIKLTENDSCRYRVVKSEVFHGNKDFHICGSNEIAKLTPHCSNLQGNIYITLNEKSLVLAFVDYIAYLKEIGGIYSKAQSIEIMKKYL